MTEIPDNLIKLICLKVFNMIPKDADVIFSTDTYKTILSKQWRAKGEVWRESDRERREDHEEIRQLEMLPCQ